MTPEKLYEYYYSKPPSQIYELIAKAEATTPDIAIAKLVLKDKELEAQHKLNEVLLQNQHSLNEQLLTRQIASQKRSTRHTIFTMIVGALIGAGASLLTALYTGPQ